MNTHPTALELEARRKTVAANLLAGLSYREIADAMHISLGTISRDANVILDRMKHEQITSLVKARTIDARRLDRALNALWSAVLKGDLPSIDRFLKIMERRAKLLGIDAPIQTELTGKDGEAMEINVTADAAEALARRLLPEFAFGGAPTPPVSDDADTARESVL